MTHSIDIEEEWARVLQEEINREVLTEIKIKKRVDDGWTLVTIGDDVSLKGIDKWIGENIKNEWRAYDERWLFKDSQDAMLFKMTWM